MISFALVSIADCRSVRSVFIASSTSSGAGVQSVAVLPSSSLTFLNLAVKLASTFALEL